VLLLLDHVLILLGAFFLVVGAHRGMAAGAAWGIFLIAAGVGTEIAVIGWTVSLARHPPSQLGTPLSPGSVPALGPGLSLCPGCGWSGRPTGARLCPRCLRGLVRKP